jgi:hypothetical protein
MLVFVAVGVMLLQTYRAMLHEAPAPAPSAPVSPPTAPIADFGPPDLLQPGAWSLGDSSWTVALTDLATAEGVARLQSLGFRGEIKDELSPLEEKALAWLKGSQSRLVEGCRVYEVSAIGFRIRAVTRIQGGSERLQLVQALWKRGNVLQMLEAMPAATLVRENSNAEHLLPPQSDVPSLARRWSPSGTLTCEILGPATQLEQALKAWSAAGWSEDRSPEEGASSPLHVLRNGDRTVRLFSMQAGPQGSGDYLLLTTEPSKQQGAN